MLEFLRNMTAMRRHENERGASAVEYGLLIAGVAALIVVIVFAFGGVISEVFNDTCTTVETQTENGGGDLDAVCNETE